MTREKFFDHKSPHWAGKAKLTWTNEPSKKLQAGFFGLHNKTHSQEYCRSERRDFVFQHAFDVRHVSKKSDLHDEVHHIFGFLFSRMKCFYQWRASSSLIILIIIFISTPHDRGLYDMMD
jgi:hypothetical protein